LPDPEKPDQARHADQRGTDVDNPRIDEIRDQVLRDRKGHATDDDCGQIWTIPRQPAKAQISQAGTISEKNGNWRPTMAPSK